MLRTDLVVPSGLMYAKKEGGGGPAPGDPWWTWLSDQGYNVMLAMEFRNAVSMADATKIGTTPTILSGPETFTSKGLVCSGATALDTGITGLNSANASMYSLYSSMSSTQATRSFAGVYNSSGSTTMYYQKAREGIENSMRYCTGQNSATADNGPISYNGGYGIAGNRAYRDGVIEPASSAGSGTTTLPMYVCCINLNGSAGQWVFCDMGTFVLTSDAISSADMAELHDRME